MITVLNGKYYCHPEIKLHHFQRNYIFKSLSLIFRL